MWITRKNMERKKFMNNYYINTKQSIDILKLSLSTLNLLKNNNVDTLQKLIKKKKDYLKQIGCTPIQISEIEIKLQLVGLDLNMKKNSTTYK